MVNSWEKEYQEKRWRDFKMKFMFTTAAAIFLIVGIVIFTNLTKVTAGNVGVKVHLLGSSKGVDSEEVGPGRYWVGWNEEMYIFPTFTQNYTWEDTNGEAIKFQTSEGMKVSADIGISYRIEPTKVNDIFQKYRRGVAEITDIYLRNMVRDAINNEASKKPVEYVYGAGKEELMQSVERRVKDQVEGIGIIIEKIYLTRDIDLPPEVVSSLNLKIQANQQAQQRQNEIATARAEADKKIEEARGVAQSIQVIAKSQADANKILSESITPQLVQYKSLEKWDGILPRMTGGAVPFINIDGIAEKKVNQ